MAHASAFRRYQHRPVVVGIDIYTVEAEAYGSAVAPPGGNLPPSVEERLCQNLNDILELPPLNPDRDGRIPMILEAAATVQALHPDAEVRVPISGPFSVATTLMGFEPLLYELLADDDHAAQALEHLAAGQRAICRVAAERGVEVLLFESAAAPPLLSPVLFRTVVLPALHSVMEEASAALAHRVGVIMGGNVAPILPSLLEARPGSLICPMETDRAAFIKTMRSAPEVTIRINTPPELYIGGPWEQIEKELRLAAQLAGDRAQAVIGTGVLAYETDPALVLRAGEFVRSLG